MTVLTPEAKVLIARARELAQDAKGFRCAALHLLWACVEDEPGDAARKLRSACHNATNHLMRRPDEPPPLRDELAGALEAWPTRPLDPAQLFAIARSSKLPPNVKRRLDDWQTPAARPAPPAVEESAVTWRRFELDDGTWIRFLELVTEGEIVYARRGMHSVRTGRQEGKTDIEIKRLQTAPSAERSVQRRIKNAAKKDYLETEPVTRALPEQSSAEGRQRGREAASQERVRKLRSFEEHAVAFFTAWHGRGYDPRRTFHQEGQTRSEDWNRIAGDCAGLANAHCGARISFLVLVDEEHGKLGSMRERHYANFFASPAMVARMAFASIDTATDYIHDYFLDSSALPDPDDEVGRALARWIASRG